MGFCAIAWSDAGVSRFQLPTKTAEATERLMRRRAVGTEPAAPPADVAAVIEAAKRYFAGEETDFSQVQLDLGSQDAFFAQIYDALRRIGWGSTTTYGALAKEVGAGREAARDVGEAMARNPAPLIIPCHRVLAAGGKIGGFSAPGGSKTKARMLELEGVRVGSPKAAQQAPSSDRRCPAAPTLPAPDPNRESNPRPSRARSTGERRHRQRQPRRAARR
jgi:methylated-DNA-[protein]-cysteine S-methyltransferase